MPGLPKFNTQTPAVREFLWSVATHWTEFGIDGWRLDVPGEINDDDFWREFRRRVKAANPDAYIVGEIWHEATRWLQGDQFDATMNYLLTVACLGFFGGERLDLEGIHRLHSFRDVRPLSGIEFADRIDWILSLYDPAITQAQLNVLSTHDTPRFITSVGGDQMALRLALLFLFTYPGAPCIYYGDEIGLAGGHDPDCRKAFPWDRSQWNHDLLAFVKQCIALRRTYRALRHGAYVRLYADNDLYVFGRKVADQVCVIALNVSSDARVIDAPVSALGVSEGLLLDTGSGVRWPIAAGMLRELKLAPRSGAVLVQSGVQSEQ
jgi:neopullulanase